MNQLPKRHSYSSGFTMVELSLAMVFVAILLLSVAIMTIQISQIYNKGITLRQVNEAGRSISRDFDRTVGSSMLFDATEGGPAYVNKATGGTLGGRLCLGTYTYVWNYAESFMAGHTPFNKYAGGSPEQIRFIKVNDPGATLCASPYPDIPSTRVSNLLEAGDRDLMIWKMKIQQASISEVDNQALYHIQFTIGTSGTNGAIDTVSVSCKPPSDAAAYDEYCSVNDFDVVVRAGNNSEGGS